MTFKTEIRLEEATEVVGELMERLKRRGDVHAPPDLPEGFFRKLTVLADGDSIDLQTFVDMAIRHFARHGYKKPLDAYERVMVARAIVAEELAKILFREEADEEAIESLSKFIPHASEEVREELESLVDVVDEGDIREEPSREDLERVIETFGSQLSDEAIMDLLKTAIFGPEKKRMLENITDEHMVGSLLQQHIPRPVIEKLAEQGRLDVLNRLGSPIESKVEAIASPHASDSYSTDQEELEKTFSDEAFNRQARQMFSELARRLNELAEQVGIEQALERAKRVSEAIQAANDRWERAAKMFERAIERQLTERGPSSDPVKAYRRGAPMDPNHVKDEAGQDPSDYTASLEQAQFVVEGIERRGKFRNPLLSTVQANDMIKSIPNLSDDQFRQQVRNLLRSTMGELEEWAKDVGRDTVRRVLEELKRAEEHGYYVPEELKEKIKEALQDLQDEPEKGREDESDSGGPSVGASESPSFVSQEVSEEGEEPTDGESGPIPTESASGVGKGGDPAFAIDRSFPERKKFLKILQSESLKILDEGHEISREFEDVEEGEAKAHFGWLYGFDRADFPYDVDFERSLEEGCFKNVPLTLYRREFRNKDEPKVAILLDSSGSMSGDKMEVAATLAAALFETVGVENVGLWAFRSEVHQLKDFEEVINRRKLIEKILGIPAGGGTDPVKPLIRVLDSLESVDHDKCKVIYITDAIFMHDDFIRIRNLLSDRDDIELYALLIKDEFEHTGPTIFKRITEEFDGGVVQVNPRDREGVREKLRQFVDMISD
ncbi:VWA domain-containing protein [Methanopyrus sp. KOL6]|uniref:vWA domain-containing protein n=1 Tax=Methanopyrus sp. KOL6 TaxID=1937004 RepID=UPI000B4C050F|nr:VWA domain-containing protein [Methanopyrus sp. KOL6]